MANRQYVKTLKEALWPEPNQISGIAYPSPKKSPDKCNVSTTHHFAQEKNRYDTFGAKMSETWVFLWASEDLTSNVS
jgi:hypothetical protein